MDASIPSLTSIAQQLIALAMPREAEARIIAEDETTQKHLEEMLAGASTAPSIAPVVVSAAERRPETVSIRSMPTLPGTTLGRLVRGQYHTSAPHNIIYATQLPDFMPQKSIQKTITHELLHFLAQMILQDKSKHWLPVPEGQQKPLTQEQSEKLLGTSGGEHALIDYLLDGPAGKPDAMLKPYSYIINEFLQRIAPSGSAQPFPPVVLPFINPQ